MRSAFDAAPWSPRVIVFADAGVGIGLGHLVRCAGLTEALGGYGANVRLLTTAGSLATLPKGMVTVGVEEVRSTAVGLREICEAHSADLLVVDSYRLGRDDRIALRRAAAGFACFDDTGAHSYGADVVINGSPAASEIRYAAPDGAVRLLGPSYQIFRREFAVVPSSTTLPGPTRMLVSVGGGDHLGILPGLIRCLAGLVADRAGLQVQVVAGPYSASPVTGTNGRMRVVAAVEDMRAEILAAHVALSAGGQTMLELVRCGTPTLAFAVGEDQMPNLRALVRAGGVEWGGSALEPGWLDELPSRLAPLLDGTSRRIELGRRAAAIFDGRGAERVAQTLYAFCNREPGHV